MKTVFDQIRNLCEKKHHHTFKSGERFDAYMVQRYLSFLNPSLACYFNETFNAQWSSFPDDQARYDFLYYTLPKQRFSYQQCSSSYVKKPEQPKTKQIGLLGEIASSLMISKREARAYIEQDDGVLKYFKKLDKVSVRKTKS